MGPGFHTEYMLLCVCDQQVNQDFLLLFGAETASKMLEKWDTSFKLKFIKEAKQLTPTTELCRLLKAAEKLAEKDETGKLHSMHCSYYEFVSYFHLFLLDINALFFLLIDWDSDIASMLLLLYLSPPTAGGKRTKISPSAAVEKMVYFHKVHYMPHLLKFHETVFFCYMH